ncbi:hypothetical protein GCM10018793_55470 [Streptomyces sulfonofaciens]|uniref:Uncharacterized protein n=1 Tax=Streptomyces sulfonofaciens TaxID=68272 RepID=A0A919GK27_9ACTN|nr:hypothetical protein [Streptomyces sulfonofaciens]GHH85866.1 hypothetical protein GCM10018793_55470 [Streptomyces sulfonofaciens]
MVAKSVEGVQAVEDVVTRLRGALAALGVVLPSLRIDPLTAASEEPYPLVELGRCNMDTALRLVAALGEARR